MQKSTDANRYVQLTETGLNRLHTARRRYKSTIDDIIGDLSQALGAAGDMTRAAAE